MPGPRAHLCAATQQVLDLIIELWRKVGGDSPHPQGSWASEETELCEKPSAVPSEHQRVANRGSRAAPCVTICGDICGSIRGLWWQVGHRAEYTGAFVRPGVQVGGQACPGGRRAWGHPPGEVEMLGT